MLSECSHVVTEMIDSGSEGNIMDKETAKRLNVPLCELETLIDLTTINGGSIGKGQATHMTEPITLQVSFLHQELSSFLVTRTTRHAIILGAPCLHLHNPTISWREGEITLTVITVV